MDESKPPIPPSEIGLRSASGRTCAAVDPVAADLAKSGDADEWQGRAGQVDIRRNDPPDRPSVAVYCRDEAEVREGFLIALSAMGVAMVEQLPEPAKPAISSAKP